MNFAFITVLGLLNPYLSTHHYLNVSNGIGKGKVIAWNETDVSRQVSSEIKKTTYNVRTVSSIYLRLYSL